MIRRHKDPLEQRDPALIERVARAMRSPLRRWFRSEVRGLERIPSGAGLYVGNHNGGFVTPDTWILAAAIQEARGVGNVPYGLAHDLVLHLPIFKQILEPLGAVPAKHENARKLFDRGRKVLVYPGGDIDAFRPWRHRDRVIFGERRGYMRLAIAAGVPIIPVVAAGAHGGFIILDDLRWLASLIGAKRFLRVGVWPLTVSFPWGLTLGPPPPYVPFPTRILIEVLEPVHFERTGEEAASDEAYVAECSDVIQGRLQATLTSLAAERRRVR
jgi:1-acyl-sn-glycerol-3-phosphate acyltransferase